MTGTNVGECRASAKAGGVIVCCDKVKELALPAVDFPNAASQMRTAFSSMDCKDRLKIAWGATDNLEHL